MAHSPPSPASPSPPRRKRRVLSVIISLLFIAMLAVAEVSTRDRVSPTAPPSSSIPAPSAGGSGPLRVSAPGSPTNAAASWFPHGLARAYTALGAVEDGYRATLPELDADASHYIDEARMLLAQQRALMKHKRPTSAPISADEKYSAPSTTARDRKPIPVVGDTNKTITEPDAWVAIPYHPQRANGQPLTITNHSTGAYTFSVEGDDLSSVRVNGGLVVPGRAYELAEPITITSEVPVGVHLRPLATAADYAPAPLMPPHGHT